MTQQKITTATTGSGLHYRSGVTNIWHLYCHSSMSCPWQILLIDHGILSKPRSNLRIFHRAPYQSATINQVGVWDEGYIQTLIKTIEQDGQIRYPSFVSPFNNKNMTSLHEKKKCLCGSFRMEVGDFESSKQSKTEKSCFQKVDHGLNYRCRKLYTPENLASTPFGFCSVTKVICQGTQEGYGPFIYRVIGIQTSVPDVNPEADHELAPFFLSCNLSTSGGNSDKLH